MNIVEYLGYKVILLIKAKLTEYIGLFCLIIDLCYDKS